MRCFRSHQQQLCFILHLLSQLHFLRPLHLLHQVRRPPFQDLIVDRRPLERNHPPLQPRLAFIPPRLLRWRHLTLYLRRPPFLHLPLNLKPLLVNSKEAEKLLELLILLEIFEKGLAQQQLVPQLVLQLWLGKA